jgi:hypothetical protein
MAYETDLWPVVKAKWFGPKRSKTNLIVIHTMEFAEQATAAEVIARDFATRPESNKASSTICVDDDSIIQCVLDSYEAYGAPPVNDRAIHIEHAGFMSQTVQQWRDSYSLAMLGLSADAAAQYCLKYDIPAIHLTDDQLRNGSRGFVGHDQVSRVWHQTTHEDPGINFPWARYMAWVKGSLLERRPMNGRL